ncbi:unnamed protein product [Cyclocybe aegerita]|uniref:Histone chaperone RTT106/FACT complex subunit SPT16-like middle domain-containing protein n=1 Tax=Cyclocybe aegerita TaxID=1973307 RepID=A0A8S0VUT7_CYCAE|nr:unnamed protein product [Cyclocybe aegerita]
MASEMHYLRAIIPSLPTEIAAKIRSLCVTAANESLLENLVRFLAGAGHASDASVGIQEQWSEKQATTRTVLAGLRPTTKRGREEGGDTDSQQSKRQRLSPATAPTNNGPPIFTLHAISATSPVRKKVDITIHENLIALTNPTSRALEASVPLSSIRRAFIVPTRGKSKPHWTVILLSSDVPDKGKPTPGFSSENLQIIFGLDATSASTFNTTTYAAGEPSAHTQPKGTSTLLSIKQFLSHLPIPTIEPSTDVFKSACTGSGSSAGVNGIPGVEAYRAAKAGNLWFSAQGILWGESKPCEFWAVGDLLGKMDGVRIAGAGRSFTVILTRRSTEGEDEEESEFGMVDGREREGVNEWVRNHWHLFGRTGSEEEGVSKPKPKVQNLGPMTIRTLQDESDDEDEDFETDVSSLDGSEALSSNENSTSDEGGSDEEDDNNGNDGVKTEDPAKHPLLRPGAVPKMSKAALEMAVGIIEEDFAMGDSPDEHDELEEEDELDD